MREAVMSDKPHDRSVRSPDDPSRWLMRWCDVPDGWVITQPYDENWPELNWVEARPIGGES
jgi:hypothetical protein